jgi:rubrerythrin
MVKKFQRKIEDFVCEHCGAAVTGNGYTDHCPVCLYGKHVDIFPGDRLEECHGLLMPIAIIEQRGRRSLEYQCQKCGETMTNRVADEDSREALVDLAKELAKKFSH